jgi:hypothetical protein
MAKKKEAPTVETEEQEALRIYKKYLAAHGKDMAPEVKEGLIITIAALEEKLG